MNKGTEAFPKETKNGYNGHSQGPSSQSPQHRRVEAKGTSYFDPNRNGRKESVVRLNSIGAYRDTAVFPDEGPDQLGIDTPILSCRFIF